jgi:tetratricopeptide (TPR) repeat protein
MSSTLDSDILFALLAARAGDIDPQSLKAALGEWAKGDERTLGEVLVERGSIDGARRETLERLADDPSRVWPSIRYSEKKLHRIGGVGRVWKATDTELHRKVAYKDLKENIVADPRLRAQFLLEAEITGRLEHPGIVPVYSLGADSIGRPFYATKFIEGRELEEAIEKYHRSREEARPGELSLALRELVNHLIAVCQTASYAHSRGVVHRDIKPKNILLGQYGETLLVDWGLARALGQPGESSEAGVFPLVPSSGSGSSLTLSGNRSGTRGFIAPEYADGGRVGIAGDIYSLGATLYHILVGRRPLGDIAWPIFLEKLKAADFPRPRQVDATIPPALEAVCLKAMATDPKDRYPTATELAGDLTRWLADEPVLALTEPFSIRAGRWVRRHKPAVAGAAMFLLAAFVFLSGSLVAITREKKKVERSLQLVAAAIKDTVNEFAWREIRGPEMEQARERISRMGAWILRELDRQHPTDLDTRRNLIAMARGIGEMHHYAGRTGEALNSFDLAIRMDNEMARDLGTGGTDPALSIGLHGARAMALMGTGKLRQSEEEMRSTIAAAEESRVLAPVHLAEYQLNLGEALRQRHQLDEARRLADDVAEGLATSARSALPNDPEITCLAMARILQIRIAFMQDRHADAVAICRRGVQDFSDQKLSATNAHLRSTIQTIFAQLLLETKDFAEAEKLTSAAIKTLRELFRDRPHFSAHRMGLAQSLITHAEILFSWDAKRTDEARAQIDEALDLLRPALSEAYADADVQSMIGEGNLILGRISLSENDLDHARICFGRAVEVSRKASEMAPESSIKKAVLDTILRETEAILTTK